MSDEITIGNQVFVSQHLLKTKVPKEGKVINVKGDILYIQIESNIYNINRKQKELLIKTK